MPKPRSRVQGDQLELDLLGSIIKTPVELLPNNPTPSTPAALLPNNHTLEQKWIKRSGKLYGPYLYERWRENGRQRSRYIGKADRLPQTAPDSTGEAQLNA